MYHLLNGSAREVACFKRVIYCCHLWWHSEQTEIAVAGCLDKQHSGDVQGVWVALNASAISMKETNSVKENNMNLPWEDIKGKIVEDMCWEWRESREFIKSYIALQIIIVSMDQEH